MSDAPSSIIQAMLRRQRAGTLEVLARMAPLPIDLLDRACWNRHLLHHNSRLDWPALLRADDPPFAIDHAKLSEREGGKWTAKLIERHADSWSWRALSANPSLPWSSALIGRFEDRWDWTALSSNRALPFDHGLLRRFDRRWVVSRLAANTSLHWDLPTLEQFEARLDEPDPSWHPMLEHERPESVAPGITLCGSGWEHLQQNPNADWARLLDRLPAPNWRRLSANRGLPWSQTFLRRHAERLDPARLAGNPALPWTVERVEQMLDRRQPQVAHNPALPWTEELVRRFADRWNWSMLSGNAAVPWSVALLDDFCDRIDWGRLSGAGHLSAAILERFADRFDWNVKLSCNPNIEWDAELIAAHAERVHWERLSWHLGLPWSTALLERFADRWVVRSFGRNQPVERGASLHAGRSPSTGGSHGREANLGIWPTLAPHIDDGWLRELVGY